MSFEISKAFLDGRIDKGDAQMIFQKANPHHTLHKGDDQEALAHNVAREISQATSGRVSEADAMGVSQTIVKELYESVVHSSGNGKFDTITSPFKVTDFDFPVITPQQTDEITEGEVAAKVKGRDKATTVAALQDPAAKKDFLERCTQLDGKKETTWDRSACAVVSTLGGYVLADPAAFQQLGKALHKGDVPQIPGFAKFRDSRPEIKHALDAIASGKFSPMDLLHVADALYHVTGGKDVNYQTGEKGGLSVYAAAVMVERLTAAGAPPPDGLTLGGIGGTHQVVKYKDLYFDSSATAHSLNGFKPFHGAVAPQLTYAAAGIDQDELVFSQSGRHAVLDMHSAVTPPTVLQMDEHQQFQVVSGDPDNAQQLKASRDKAHL